MVNWPNRAIAVLKIADAIAAQASKKFAVF
jgi:hypothetical protein